MDQTPETPLKGANPDSQVPDGNWYNWRNYAGKRNPDDSVLSPQGTYRDYPSSSHPPPLFTTSISSVPAPSSSHFTDTVDTGTITNSLEATPPSSRHKKLLQQNPPILSPSSAIKYPPPPPPSLSSSSSSSSTSSSLPPYTSKSPSSSTVSSTTVLTFWDYLFRELGWGLGLPWYRKSSSTQHVINFLSVPLHLEPLLLFGHAICFDMFLFQFTLLPVRCFIGIYTFVSIMLQNLWNRGKRCIGLSSSFSSSSSLSSPAQSFTRAHAYDIIRMMIIIVATIVLGWVQVSRVYHYIRGEAIIKLYVIFNILEIFDKLMSSLGTDIMDALYRTTRDHLTLPAICISTVPLSNGNGSSSSAPLTPVVASLTPTSSSNSTVSSPPPTVPLINGTLRLGFHIIVAICYCIAHALILFIQIVCLNVAINSRNNALLTLMISNNFVELKSSVFRRFESENLFQVTCADIVERFQLVLFLGLISLQELSSWNTLLTLFPSMLLIIACEIIVDYVKYSFISKFNCIHTHIFSTFKTILAHDLVSVRSRIRTSLDPTHTCVKRLGLATLPLTVVVYRMILLKLTPDIWLRLTSLYGIIAVFLFWGCLLLFKNSFSMVLLAHAAKITSTIVSSTVGHTNNVNSTVGTAHPHHPPISGSNRSTSVEPFRSTSTGSDTTTEVVPTTIKSSRQSLSNNSKEKSTSNPTMNTKSKDRQSQERPLFDTLSTTNRYTMKGGRIPL